MKLKNDSNNLERVVADLIKKLKEDVIGNGVITGIDIEIPEGLYYYAESKENGNEDQMEDKTIYIRLFGHDERDSRQIIINIKEHYSLELSIQNKNIPDEVVSVIVELSYQIARMFIFMFILDSSPYSVNLRTK
jgi:hypothetical protein